MVSSLSTIRRRFHIHEIYTKNEVHFYDMFNFDFIILLLHMCSKQTKVSLCFNTSSVLFFHYENTPIQIYCKFHFQKTENFQMKNSDIFHISAQNIDCKYSLKPPRRGGSNEYPQSMFLSRNKKNNVYLCKPQFYYIKVGFKGVKII